MVRWIDYINDKHEDWIVLIIGDMQRVSMIGSGFAPMNVQLIDQNEAIFSGIHRKNIRVYVNKDKQPKWLMNKIYGLTTSYASSIRPLGEVE